MRPTNDNRPCYYIGVATTFHDPAFAIISPRGEILFAEATERSLQDKRALDQRAEPFACMPQLLRRFCDPEAELIVATSWSRLFAALLSVGMTFGQLSFPNLSRRPVARHRWLVPEFQRWTYAALMHSHQERAGLGVLTGTHEAFGHRRVRLERCEHHLTHATHACLTSPFTDAVCAVVDGMGEFGSLAIYHYQAGNLRRLRRQVGTESLGLFYWLVTDYCGFSAILGEEWKVMGLASYGEPDAVFEDLLRSLCAVRRGRIEVPSKSEVARITQAIARRLGPVEGDPLRAANLARAGQTVFTENMTKLLRPLAEQGLSENLVLTGGCALNSAYNGSLLAETGFHRLYVPAAPGDDGNAVGAALVAYRKNSAGQRWMPGQHGKSYPFVGSELSTEALRRVKSLGVPGRTRQMAQGLVEEVARLLDIGKVVGWIQGRAEFGPRALGNRSILADPRSSTMKDHLNRAVKFRENFRPFAPAILHERGSDYFENYEFTPHMERTARFRRNVAGRVPAVVHVDGTGRLQSVTRQNNPRFHALIEAFNSRTGIPLLVNTSCNVMHKPMVHTVEDAVGLFFSTGLDVLVLDDLLIEK